MNEHNAEPAHDNLRDNIGQALSDVLAEWSDDGSVTFDPFDANNIDELANAVVAALSTQAAPLPLGASASPTACSVASLPEPEVSALRVPPAGAELDAMVGRFLWWPLPKGFSPDCGISFDGRKPDQWNPDKTWPVGTNLFTAEQAREMLLHVLGGAK